MRGAMILFFVAGTMPVANAEQHVVRQEEAHLHGAARLNIVLDQHQLLIELESPAFNIVGFEHQPGNAEQEEAVHSAEEALNDAAQQIALPSAAECRLVSVDVEHGLAKDHDKEHEESSDTHDHQEDAEGPETHSDFHVQYAYSCGSPDQLNEVGILLFQHFPNLEEIDAQVIGPEGQTAIELTADNNRIDFGI